MPSLFAIGCPDLREHREVLEVEVAKGARNESAQAAIRASMMLGAVAPAIFPTPQACLLGNFGGNFNNS